VTSRTFLRILEELGWPKVYLIPPKQFFMGDGKKIRGSAGLAEIGENTITLLRGLRGKELSNTIYHEIGHHLFPYRKHWWIECAAERLARGGGRGYWSIKYGHTVNEMPTRYELLKMFRRASKRFNEQYKTNIK
jgi:hypothetical protein